MKLVCIKTFLYRHEAEVVKGLLAEHGIESLVSADDLGGSRVHLTFGTANVRLLVSESVAQAAKELIDETEASGE